MAYSLHLVNNLLKRRCEDALTFFWKPKQSFCVICPKKGSKKFFEGKADTIVAANDYQTDIWEAVKDADHVFCYDFDNFSIETQALIYHLKDKEVYIWTKPKYVRDCYNFADNDFLYKIYIDPTTAVTVSGNIKFQNLPKKTK